MIIDTHVHIWEIDPLRYPIGPTAPSWDTYPDEAGTALELVEEMDLYGVDRAVLVQSSWSTWDNGYSRFYRQVSWKVYWPGASQSPRS